MNIRNTVTTVALAGASALTIAALVAAVTVLVPARQAAATPAFGQQTSLPCGQCHANAAGGGALKPFGAKFKANGNKLDK